MNCDLETFEYGLGGDQTRYVVIERREASEYEKVGERRIAFFMRSQNIVATVKARKERGHKQFLFYEVSKAGRVCYVPAGKRVR